MIIPEFNIQGRKVVLIGASRGIGKGIAEVLAQAGADVVVTGLTKRAFPDLERDLRKHDGKVITATADATDPDSIRRLEEKVLSDVGQIDMLVNCTGDSIPGLVAPTELDPGMQIEDWRRIMGINLDEAYIGCHIFGRHFIERNNGSVVNISSTAAFRPKGGRSAYATAKAGLVAFTKALALEWAQYGVRVNAIAPGLFPDPAQMTSDAYGQANAAASERVPLGRLGQPREVGYLALFLLSDAAAYLTGQTIVIDGGISLAQ